jgi:hypothetical protein
VGSTDPPEDWTIVSRGTKRHRERKEGQMNFTGKGAEDDKREEEERLDHQQGKDELSQQLQLKGEEISKLKKDLENMKLQQVEATQREKGISLQLQQELKMSATMTENNNYLHEQMKQQELTFQLAKEQLSKENEELKYQLGDLDSLKEKASQYDILNLDYVDQQRQFYALGQRYTEQS